MNYDAFQHSGFQPLGFQETAVSVGAYSGVGSGVYQRPDLTAYLAALNAAQLERRKKDDELYLAAMAHNAQLQRERRAAALERRQREEEWIVGLLTTEQMLEAA